MIHRDRGVEDSVCRRLDVEAVVESLAGRRSRSFQPGFQGQPRPFDDGVGDQDHRGVLFQREGLLGVVDLGHDSQYRPAGKCADVVAAVVACQEQRHVACAGADDLSVARIDAQHGAAGEASCVHGDEQLVGACQHGSRPRFVGGDRAHGRAHLSHES
nr:hypothetical protein [Streptomyces antimycoticus]